MTEEGVEEVRVDAEGLDGLDALEGAGLPLLAAVLDQAQQELGCDLLEDLVVKDSV